MPHELSEHLKPYDYHGVSLSHYSGQEWTGDCPACSDTNNHWHVNATNGLWSCKKCGEEGNIYTFLKLYHEELLANTTKRDYQRLAKLREPIHWSTFQKRQVAYDPDRNRWIIPIRNLDGKLANLRDWSKGPNSSMTFRNTAGCASHMFMGDRIEHDLVIICEGEWDAIALDFYIRKAGISASVVAVPGANVFKVPWAFALAGKEVWLVYDKDPDKELDSGKVINPGRDGMLRTLKVLLSQKNKPSSIKLIEWPKGLPDKYDIRDFCRDHKGKPKLAWKNLSKIMVEPEDVDLTNVGPGIVRTSFSEVLDDFRQHARVDSAFEDALAVCLATALSVRIPGDPIWLFLVAPPGAGKTLLLDAFASAREYCECLSKITDKTLVSGWKAEGGDASLIPTLNGRTLVIKDYTTIISMSAGTQEALYGILRDVYDGEFSTQYGNRERREFHNVSFSMIAGVTDAIHRNDRAELGERFLKIELLAPEHDNREHIIAAMQGTNLKVERSKALRDSVYAYLSNDLDTSNLPIIPGWMLDKFVDLAMVVAYVRTGVARGSSRDILYRPRAEVGSRPGAQLKRLAQCLYYVLGKSVPDDEVYRLCYKVAMDTCYGLQLELVSFLSRKKKDAKGIPTNMIAYNLKLSETHVKRLMDDMLEIGIVDFDFVSNGSGSRGRNAKVWKLSPLLQSVWDGAKPNVRSRSTTRNADTNGTKRRKRVRSDSINRGVNPRRRRTRRSKQQTSSN